MTARKSVHIVPHTHWDREWYFSTDQSQVLLSFIFRDILDQLEQDDCLPCFVLDGQSVMLEDYLSVQPEEKPRIRELVKQGKLMIGPWYTQTDQCVVHGESQLRNLYYGHKDCEAYGSAMPVGYVPDSFGQSEQLPQLLNHFGIDKAVFWRGIWEGISPSTEFVWCSRDGSQVKTAVLEFGYSAFQGMKPMASHIEAMGEKVETPNWPRSREHILMMGGHDQKPWQKETAEKLKEASNNSDIEYKLGTFDDFFAAAAPSFESAQPVTSEMLYGKYSRIHRGIYSTRYDIKKLNADIEHRIVNQLEPLLTLGWSLGMRYPHGLMEQNWKRLMQCHAHDSIGCCNTDNVNQQIKTRLAAINDNTSQLLNLTCRQISEAITPKQQGEKLVIFNALPEQRSTLIKADVILPARQLTVRDSEGCLLPCQITDIKKVDINQVVQDPTTLGDDRFKSWYHLHFLLDAGSLPALGYKTCYVLADNNDSSTSHVEQQETALIENTQIAVQVSNTGKVTIVDKANNKTYTDALTLVDGGDDGDNYDYSPPREDWLIDSSQSTASITCETGELESTITINQVMALPANLEERKARKTSIKQPITLTLALQKNSPYLNIAIHLDNQAEDHRLQLIVKGDFTEPTSLADQPFGLIRRDNDQDALSIWQEQEWTSAPAPIYPMQSLVSMSSDDSGLAILTNGIREYEMPGHQPECIAVTLFRSVGCIGKPDLLYRPGRLSGLPDPSPDSQLKQPLTFELAVLPHRGKESEAGLTKIAKTYLTPPVAYHDGRVNRFMLSSPGFSAPETISLLAVETELTVSAIKKSESSEQIVIRLFNDSDETRPIGKIHSAEPVFLADGMERKQNRVPDDHSLPPQRFETYLI